VSFRKRAQERNVLPEKSSGKKCPSGKELRNEMSFRKRAQERNFLPEKSSVKTCSSGKELRKEMSFLVEKCSC